MKKVVSFIICFAILIAIALLSGVLFLCSRETGSVFVNFNLVAKASLFFDPTEKHIHLPVISTLRLLKYDIIETDAETLLIEMGNKQFLLDLDKESLYEIGDSRALNYLDGAPGITYHYCQRVGDDIIVDTETLSTALYLMNSNYRITVIHILKVVLFTYRT